MDTKFAKPSAVSAELPEAVYCIRCERMVKAEQGANGLRHAKGDWKEEVEFCHFPDGYAFTPPPEEPPFELTIRSWLDGQTLDTDDGDWAAQDDPGDGEMCADEVGAWED